MKKFRLNLEKIKKPDKFPGNEIIISYLSIKATLLLRNMVKTEKKIKSPENPEEIWKPNKFPENEIMVSYLINKPSILSRNIKKIDEI